MIYCNALRCLLFQETFHIILVDVEAMFELAGKKGTGQKKKNSQKLTEEEELIATCGKDDRVGVLHGVGRVLFPKCKFKTLFPRT